MADFSLEHHPAPPTPNLPLALRPVLVERVWGTTNLGSWHKGGPTGKPIGEIWLTAEECTVASGPEAGRTLKELTTAHPEVFPDPNHQGFPLLLKLLFPREKLSVQVHPDDTQAQAQGMPRGKTECWYVIEAEPGAEVAVGFNQPLSTADVRASIQDGSIESKLRKIPVQIGDMILVDAGTVHAIGPGMIVLETQQYSDTTYRLWDYGRPRELHVEPGMAVTRTETAAGPVQPVPMEGFTRVASSPFFLVDRFSLDGVENIRLDSTEKVQILVALDEGVSVVVTGDHLFAVPRGQAVIIPGTGARYSLHSEGVADLIRVMQP